MSEQRTVKEYAAMVHGLGDVDAIATIIQHAILAERKRCSNLAKKARNDAEFYGNTDMMRAATLISHRIEAGA